MIRNPFRTITPDEHLQDQLDEALIEMNSSRVLSEEHTLKAEYHKKRAQILAKRAIRIAEELGANTKGADLAIIKRRD